MTEFEKLNLSEKIITELKKKGYTNPTPIQAQAIPHILEGKDLLGIAQTGTGKTAAFALPILDLLMKSANMVRTNNVRCLILTPTRELASQIADNIEIYGVNSKLKTAVIFGGVHEKAQIRKLALGTDILIATPGRLLDLMSQGYVQYSQLEIFVLDEADRMLDMGFINDVKKIISRLPQKRQTLFFSATMSEAISELAHQILNQPVKVEITPAFTTVEKITQKVLFVQRANKMSLLKRILKEEDVKHVLVFSQTKHGANRITEYLRTHGVKVMAIHGNKSQAAREKALADFKQGDAQVLVATDIAARGIDVPGISHVINYDIPQDPESYVHRIGRTARAGREGVAISFCDDSEISRLRAVEKVIKVKIPVDETHPYHGVEAAPMNKEFSSRERNFKPRGNSQNFQNRGRSNEERRRSNWRAEGDDRRRNDSSNSHSSRRHENSSEGNRFKKDYEKPFQNKFHDRRENSRSDDRNFSDRKHDNTKDSKFSFKKKLKSFFGFEKKEERSSLNEDNSSKRSSRPFGKKPFHKRSGTKSNNGNRQGQYRGKSFGGNSNHKKF